MITIGFFWTPILSKRVLEDIIADSRFSVQFVVTNPDKKIWRKQEISESPVKIVAKENNIPVFQPQKIRNNTELFDTFRNFWCDYFVVVAYGKILPKQILEIPTKLAVNVHGSILPKYRGASPIQSALLHGERETGVTIMEMTEGMDEGGSIFVQKILIDSAETSLSLFEKFWEISWNALIEGLIGLESGKYTPIPQNDAEATYCSKISKEDGEISWSDGAKKIFRQWQAFTPWPGIYSYYDEKRILFEKISLDTHILDKKVGEIYKNSHGKYAIYLGDGSIIPEIIKPEGKKSQNFHDFINGNKKILETGFTSKN